MKKFKEFGIKAEVNNFVGDKIKVRKILNCEITVLDFRIMDSKYNDKGNGKCLFLQIEFEGKKRVVFTGSAVLMDTIEKVKRTDFPFMTKIVEENERYEFT